MSHGHHVLAIFCHCGHVGERPLEDPRGVDRKAVLANARCGRRHLRGAAELRIIYKATANALEGTRVEQREDPEQE